MRETFLSSSSESRRSKVCTMSEMGRKYVRNACSERNSAHKPNGLRSAARSGMPIGCVSAHDAPAPTTPTPTPTPEPLDVLADEPTADAPDATAELSMRTATGVTLDAPAWKRRSNASKPPY